MPTPRNRAASPIPDSSRICGDCTAPAATITSCRDEAKRVWPSRTYSTPVARRKVLEPPHDRLDAAPVPAGAAGFAPLVPPRRVAARPDHAVHRTRPAKHLAARPVQAPVAGRRLRFRLERPDEPLVPDDAP